MEKHAWRGELETTKKLFSKKRQKTVAAKCRFLAISANDNIIIFNPYKAQKLI